MKRKNLAKKLAAMMMTGATVMSMSGMATFAATVDAPLTKAELKKNVKTDGKTYAPNTSFEFTLKTGDAGEYNNDVVFGGVQDGLTMGRKEADGTYKASVTFSPDTSNSPKKVYDETVDISIDGSKFTKPGIFHYVLKETPETYPGIVYDITERDLYVYVERDETSDTLFVAGMIAVKGDDVQYAEIPESDGTEEPQKVGLSIDNIYGDETDKEKDHIYHLTLQKEVTGNQGDKTLPFSFKVSINGGEGEKYYVEYGIIDDNEDFNPIRQNLVYIESGAAEATDIKLRDGEAIRIYGLSGDDVYTIQEVDAEGELESYTTTVTGADDGDNDRKVTGVLSDDTKIKYTNNNTVNTPTGIAMTFAPYALMVAFAGVFAVMFLRKKREDF